MFDETDHKLVWGIGEVPAWYNEMREPLHKFRLFSLSVCQIPYPDNYFHFQFGGV
jgi:hypothetical protein